MTGDKYHWGATLYYGSSGNRISPYHLPVRQSPDCAGNTSALNDGRVLGQQRQGCKPCPWPIYRWAARRTNRHAILQAPRLKNGHGRGFQGMAARSVTKIWQSGQLREVWPLNGVKHIFDDQTQLGIAFDGQFAVEKQGVGIFLARHQLQKSREVGAE